MDFLEEAFASINAAAPAVQARLQDRDGEEYSLSEVKALLWLWLQECTRELAEESTYHCCEGDRSAAFNRRGFEDLVKKLHRDRVRAEASQCSGKTLVG